MLNFPLLRSVPKYDIIKKKRKDDIYGCSFLFVLSGYFVLVLALIVGMIAVEWILFERAGQPGWKVLIPFYDSFILHKIAFGEEAKWYWFLLLVPGYGIYMRYAFTKTYGYSTGMAVLSVFFPMILSIVMVLQNAEYRGPMTHILKQ